MSETDATNRFTLTPEQPTGTVGLPYCKLVLRYQQGNDESIKLIEPCDGSERVGQDRVFLASLRVPSEIQSDLVAVLQQMRCMREKEIRDGLLWQLGPAEEDTIPRSDDMIEDLKNIVRGMAELGELHLVISAAKMRAVRSEFKDELDRIFKQLGSRQIRRPNEQG